MNQTEDWLSEEENQIQRKRIGARALVIAFFSTVLILGIGLYLFINLGSDVVSGMCGNQVITQEIQPDNGSYKLVVFKRDCGATTAYSYQLSVIKKNSQLENSAANIYISDHEFNAFWTDKNTIEIRGFSYKEYKQERKYKGIKIQYNTPW